MKRSVCRGWFWALAVVLCASGCGSLGGSGSRTESGHDLELTPLRTHHRYITPSDLQQPQIRVALVNVILRGERVRSTLAVGVFRPRDGLFKMETPLQSCHSLQALVSAFDPYVDRMPVGLILTINGDLPGTADDPPAAFGAFVSHLHQALEREGIDVAFIVTPVLHVLQ